jgi:Pvc16 N-terminal domain/IPT/TIG domain
VSDYLAVGGVTAVLTWLLASSPAYTELAPVLTGSPEITAAAPDSVQPAAGAAEAGQLNLFMYHASINPALRNLDLPSTGPDGTRLGNPPLALDLHYLISAYGAGFLTAEALLGWAMKVFHDNPVVPSATIQDALTGLANPVGGSSAAATLTINSTLATQFEHIRITPQALTTEQIYQLWAAFQAPYRPSTAFQVSVVVIQDTTPVTTGPPVRHRRLLALPLQSPVISGVAPPMPAAGQLLTITGANFLGQAVTDTVLSFDDLAAPVAPDLVQGGVIKVTLPAGLSAGTRTVRVQRMVTFPRETSARRGFTSSPAPFQLLPTITGPLPANSPPGTPVTLNATRGGSLTVDVSPPVGRTQQVTTYIGDYGVALDSRPVTAPASDGTVTFTVPAGNPPDGPGPGTFPIRIEVDGASSPLNQQANGQWTPQVVVT